MGDDGDICTECPHRREDHRDDYDEPYCHTCLNDVVMDGMWEDDERREGIFHPFGLKELAPTWDDNYCWHPECAECAESRARREFLSEMLQVMDTGVASFKMVRDLFDEFPDTSDRVNYLTREVLFRIDNLRCAIKVELDGV